MLRKSFLYIMIIIISILVIGCAKPLYNPLTQNQINKFLNKKNIIALDEKTIGNYTVILYETQNEMGTYDLTSDQFGRILEGKGCGDNNSHITPVSISGGASYTAGAGSIEFITIIINDIKIMQNAYKVKVIYDSFEVEEKTNNKKGIIIPFCKLIDSTNPQIIILDEKNRVLYDSNNME